MEVCKRKARGKIYAEALKSDNTVFVYYLLAHRYQIATGELKEGKSSWVVSIEAENRLHAQKALMVFCWKPAISS
jgi:ornithine carbamoyltransferase|tara:strand:+ start:193 stop:417 length:225 start_codon:yes stop_codon:yes gene_type:complete